LKGTVVADLPKWVFKAIEKLCRGFLWKGQEKAHGGNFLVLETSYQAIISWWPCHLLSGASRMQLLSLGNKLPGHYLLAALASVIWSFKDGYSTFVGYGWRRQMLHGLGLDWAAHSSTC
jgi:hypothetical protein